MESLGGKIGFGSAFGVSLVVGLTTVRPEITHSFDGPWSIPAVGLIIKLDS